MGEILWQVLLLCGSSLAASIHAVCRPSADRKHFPYNIVSVVNSAGNNKSSPCSVWSRGNLGKSTGKNEWLVLLQNLLNQSVQIGCLTAAICICSTGTVTMSARLWKRARQMCRPITTWPRPTRRSAACCWSSFSMIPSSR